jgi:antitoxin HicB
MARIFYPAIFHKEDGEYWVSFPDLPGCLTDGKTMSDAYEMALDALGLYLEDYEPSDYPLPQEDKLPAKLAGNERLLLVEFDPFAYKKKHARAVKKTLTIPSWLNELGEKQKVNYSKILQEALKQKLQINE